MKSPLSKLTLGTAQFGQSYGIANTSGSPELKDICRMLEAAAEEGINSIDTAAAYGNSEAILGQALAETGLKNHFHICTKITPLESELSPKEAREIIFSSLEHSREHLGINTLPLVLFHREENLVYTDALAEALNNGLCERIGVSVASPAGLRSALARTEIEAVQIPTNLLDHRFTQSGLLDQCAAQKVDVFVRSAFLQGLLLMNDADTPPHLRAIQPARSSLQAIAQRLGIPLTDMLLLALTVHPAIKSVVFGAETIQQLRENTRVLRSAPLPSTLTSQLQTLPSVPDWLLDPASWEKHIQTK